MAPEPPRGPAQRDGPQDGPQGRRGWQVIDVGSFQRGGRVGSTWKFPALPASSEVTPRRPKSRSQEGTQPPSPPLGSPMRPGGPHTWGHPLGKWLLTRSMGLAGPRHGSSHLTIQGGVSWAPTQHQVLHWVLDGGGGGHGAAANPQQLPQAWPPSVLTAPLSRTLPPSTLRVLPPGNPSPVPRPTCMGHGGQDQPPLLPVSPAWGTQTQGLP